MDFVNIIGYTATTITTAMTLPQLFRIIQTKHAKDVSLGMFVMNLCGSSLWLVYGLALRAWPIVIGNIIALFIVSTVISLKLKYDRALARA